MMSHELSVGGIVSYIVLDNVQIMSIMNDAFCWEALGKVFLHRRATLTRNYEMKLSSPLESLQASFDANQGNQIQRHFIVLYI